MCIIKYLQLYIYIDTVYNTTLRCYLTKIFSHHHIPSYPHLISLIIILAEVGMLFTPHEECQEEFKELQPGRGGVLVDHLAKAPERSVERSLRAFFRRSWV